MRILALSPTFLPAVGGAELLVLHVLRRLALRHEVRLVTPVLSEAILSSIGDPGYDHLVNFEVERYRDAVSLMRIRGHRVTGGLIPPFSLSAVAAVHRAVRRFRPHVLNVHYCMPTGLAVPYARSVLGVPAVLSLTGRDVPGPGVPRLWRMWHRLVGGASTETTFITDWCRRAVWGAQSRRGHIIPGGVDMADREDPARSCELRERFGVPNGGRLLFALQRFDPVKRVGVLVRAMPGILRREPGAVLVIGGKGAQLERVRSLAEVLGVARHVHFPGFVPDAEVYPLLMASDLFVFHSTYETFGIVAAQAMACGRAVVASADPALSEVVEHGRTGLLVPVGDHEAFADAVCDLLADDARRRTMGEAGYRRACAEYSWDAVADGYERVLCAASGEDCP
ncbi:glycosyltransferase involved in cell wall biosynthesis [Desulfobaculum xiamenense]|uniref:Glycosyltransferase involved in cell wall biosynthesis n=1 Tax=Desulfobaculum xiamenense TaxID=995050 RepID=A0A846QPE5_9BACT|nr:glycosyltransferase family 4 protein [Desulfobaculum xiamenense]NJB68362.1 glycosyltransferase involved in cell wall biosynthesis [Desulfobaculum xiamenense]